MFPLAFPLNILRRKARSDDAVLDPFCGRGTTNFAARLVGLQSLGVDSSPVAAAITASKLASVSSKDVVSEARAILTARVPRSVPSSEFWRLAYDPNVLRALCCFREAFLEDCTTDARVALRGIVLGALHGPMQKHSPSYFSNQCPRTYAPKPAYATRYWRERSLTPHSVDALAVVERRAERYYRWAPGTSGAVRLGDSRCVASVLPVSPGKRFNWVITSPPYYGMRTYVADQWLRNWFVGGPDAVDYTNRDQVLHSSPETFATELRQVWRNTASACASDAKLIIRFGGITDRCADPLEIIKESLGNSGWRIITIRQAGTAAHGKRQADTFLRKRSKPVLEYDIWTVRH